jgi:predicted TIM-barrel fold metal-dependent hydrolase
MTDETHHHRYLPHFFGFTAIIILALMFFFIFSERARSEFRIIDIHEHIGSPDKARALEEADSELDIGQTALLASPIETLTLSGNKSFTRYRENADEILKMAEEFPGRFLTFCTVSPLDADAPEYIKDCIGRGGKGIKLYNGHSYYYGVFGIPLDSPRMTPIYEYAEQNSIPVLYHVNIANYGKELENVLKKYPGLTADVPHFMVSGTNLKEVERLFDLYPNLYTDVSFGSPEFMAAGIRRVSEESGEYADFIGKYSDRILFGTDMVITETDFKDRDYIKNTLRCYKDMLEKRSFTCDGVNDYYKKEMEKLTARYSGCKPKEGKYCLGIKKKLESSKKRYSGTKTLNGLGLDDETLQKIYWENPLRFLSANR